MKTPTLKRRTFLKTTAAAAATAALSSCIDYPQLLSLEQIKERALQVIQNTNTTFSPENSNTKFHKHHTGAGDLTSNPESPNHEYSDLAMQKDEMTGGAYYGYKMTKQLTPTGYSLRIEGGRMGPFSSNEDHTYRPSEEVLVFDIDGATKKATLKVITQNLRDHINTFLSEKIELDLGDKPSATYTHSDYFEPNKDPANIHACSDIIFKIAPEIKKILFESPHIKWTQGQEVET